MKLRSLIITALIVCHGSPAMSSLMERGWIESSKAMEVRSVLSGPVIELAEHGQRVKKGDLICRQDVSSTTDELKDLENRIEELQDELFAERENLKLKKIELEKEKSMVEASLNLARVEYLTVLEEPKEETIRLIDIDIELSRLALEKAKEEKETQERMVAKGFGSSQTLEEHLIRLKAKEQNLLTVQAYKEELLKGANEEILIEKKSNLEKWEHELERKKHKDRMILNSIQLYMDKIELDLEYQIQEQKKLLEQVRQNALYAPTEGLLLFYKRRDWSAGGALVPLKIGDMIYSVEKVARIVDPSVVNVTFPLHESNLYQVQMDDTAEVTLPALPNIRLKGTVIEVSRIARDLSELLPQGYLNDHHGQSYFKVTLDLSEQNKKFKPGMSATISLNTTKKSLP